MMSQRALQTSIRRLAAQQTSRTTLSPFAAPIAVALNTHYIQKRPATSSSNDAHDILVKQRLNRPVAPHLSIYKPQITWYGSAANRVTGVIVSGGVYAFGLAYLAAPMLGWNLSSASVAAAFAAWPVVLKVATKMFFALPFTYHCMNGLRHIAWDFGVSFKNKQVQQTGWAVVGLSTLSALALVFFV